MFGQQRVCLDEVKKNAEMQVKNLQRSSTKDVWTKLGMHSDDMLVFMVCFSLPTIKKVCTSILTANQVLEHPVLKHEETAQFCPDLSRSCSSQESSWPVKQRQPKLSECLRKSVSLMDLCDPWQLPGNVKLLYTFRYL